MTSMMQMHLRALWLRSKGRHELSRTPGWVSSMWLLIEPQSEKAHTEDVSRKVLHASRFPNIKAVKRASNDHGTDAGTHAETITYAREIRAPPRTGECGVDGWRRKREVRRCVGSPTLVDGRSVRKLVGGERVDEVVNAFGLLCLHEVVLFEHLQSSARRSSTSMLT